MSTAGGAALDEVPTPALLVDRARMEANLAAMAGALGAAGVALRPHFKTSKCVAVARRQLAHGAIGFTCATPAEVALLQDAGVEDVLWAHQPVGPAKVAFAVRALARGGLTVALDSVEAAGPLARAAEAAGVEVPFVLEVDTGLHRAGVDPDRAVRVAAELAALPALRMRGVLTHEGHLAAHGSDRAGLEAAGGLAGRTLALVAGELRAAGHACPLVSVGSTPGATSAPFAEGVTEARPGTYVYFDANQVGLGSARIEQCAQTVLARVTSAQRPGTVIIDAGIKAMSSDAVATAGALGIVCDMEGRPLEGVEFSGGNEEHGYLTGPGTSGLRVGDLLRIVPNHACGTTNMWSALYFVEGGRAVERSPIEARY
ncbi:alanine racemase [Actinomadura viridis]|uniref:D-serine deaminase-like pyridoxal phosphate-dependent protein n=1 Tax=Actinomadura viridis TaxID=58110 RepID=A0A931GQL1_9ACTN|nr:alanine racemase [Actinomadura viridis]MBG6088654.1 D-serine deaminase-like pyridoxal phosphate-dependent protein [Actinomadura viridis]